MIRISLILLFLLTPSIATADSNQDALTALALAAAKRERENRKAEPIPDPIKPSIPSETPVYEYRLINGQLYLVPQGTPFFQQSPFSSRCSPSG